MKTILGWPAWWQRFIYREPKPTSQPSPEQAAKEEASRKAWEKIVRKINR
jgi:hypothetical protein